MRCCANWREFMEKGYCRSKPKAKHNKITINSITAQQWLMAFSSVKRAFRTLRPIKIYSEEPPRWIPSIEIIDLELSSHGISLLLISQNIQSVTVKRLTEDGLFHWQLVVAGQSSSFWNDLWEEVVCSYKNCWQNQYIYTYTYGKGITLLWWPFSSKLLSRCTSMSVAGLLSSSELSQMSTDQTYIRAAQFTYNGFKLYHQKWVLKYTTYKHWTTIGKCQENENDNQGINDDQRLVNWRT